MNKLVIFGASGGGVKIAQTLRSFNIDFEFFVDNNINLWGTMLEGKQIKSPNELKKEEFSIIIASVHQTEIEKQLEDMGQLQNIVLREDILLKEVEKLREIVKFNDSLIERDAKRKIIMELSEGMQLGGIETWALTVSKELKKIGSDILLYVGSSDENVDEELIEDTRVYNITYNDYKNNVIDLTHELLKDAPCSVIINKYTQIFYAAHLAKMINPKGIKIIGVVHNDAIYHYRRQAIISCYEDAIMCVSKRIKRRLIGEFNLNPEKIYYTESPVYVMEELKRTYTTNQIEPIKLGYAARITKMVKRADYLVELIGLLEKKQTNYKLYVAGDGPYYGKLLDYVKENSLEDKVILYGRLQRNQMADFWLDKDVFLNVSDFEGNCLSALEAMSQGVVPVETFVSGVEEFVTDGLNGYYVEVGDMETLANKIDFLSKHRELLPDMGNKARNTIVEKCNPEKYGVYIKKLCLEI